MKAEYDRFADAILGELLAAQAAAKAMKASRPRRGDRPDRFDVGPAGNWRDTVGCLPRRPKPACMP